MFLLLLLFPFLAFAHSKPIVIVTPSYNNINWFEKNLQSILNQNYRNYRIIYLDDCSKDGMGKAVDDYVKEYDHRIVSFDDSFSQDIPTVTQKFAELVNAEKHFITVIHNVNRCGALANLYRAIQSCKDKEIIATVDGDDWLADLDVLKRLNKTYRSKKVWLTHGRLQEYPHGGTGWCEPVPESYIRRNAFRQYKCPSHLRTFYAWLFKKIRLEDLLYEGKFYVMTWDMAMMYPMVEMAGNRHAYIKQVNYIYNMANQLNDNKVDPDLQNFLDRHIRQKPPYTPLKKAG